MTDTQATNQPSRTYNGIEIPVAGTYTLDANHKRVGFVARHLMVSKVRGEFKEASATIVVAEDPLQSSVTASIQADSFHSNQEQRDGHVKSPDFLHTEKWPTLEYRSTGVKSFEDNELVVTGELTIRDVTRPVDLKVELDGVGRSPYGQDVFGFSATAEIDREDFGITYNMALEAGGVMIGKTVKIEIEGEAVRQADAA
jgi:polyisoprenoid-binding protein YceI